MKDPTGETYVGLSAAYTHFNTDLFEGRLPRCMITLQRHKGAYGFFHGDRFGDREGAVTDEIAVNPTWILHRTTEDTLSTLVHEMCHLEQHHFGKASRNSYHNKEWGELMKRVGLYPSDTGAEGGKETGQKVSHYVIKGGAFERSCADLLKDGFRIDYGERGRDEEKAAKKKASKTRFSCPSCCANAWAKPDSSLKCGECDEFMEAEEV